MNHLNDNQQKTIGGEIRAVRKARGVTLKDLSERTRCSVAYLSRIERGEARLSVELMTEIGRALQVDPKWFFPTQSGAGPLERSSVVRANERRPLSNLYTRTFEELGFEDELLSSRLSGDFYLLMSRFPPGLGSLAIETDKEDGYVYEGEQHGVVISGQIELTLNEEVILLKVGDSFSYSTEIAHRFRNGGEEEAVMVWAMSPIRISW